MVFAVLRMWTIMGFVEAESRQAALKKLNIMVDLPEVHGNVGAVEYWLQELIEISSRQQLDELKP